MIMPGAQDRSSSDNAESTRKQEDEQSNLALKSNIGGNPERAKHWAKIYRTSIASGVSSVAAIVVGVSYSCQALLALAPLILLQYPLDSVKTRLQGYVFFTTTFYEFLRTSIDN